MARGQAGEGYIKTRQRLSFCETEEHFVVSICSLGARDLLHSGLPLRLHFRSGQGSLWTCGSEHLSQPEPHLSNCEGFLQNGDERQNTLPGQCFVNRDSEPHADTRFPEVLLQKQSGQQVAISEQQKTSKIPAALVPWGKTTNFSHKVVKDTFEFSDLMLLHGSVSRNPWNPEWRGMIWSPAHCNDNAVGFFFCNEALTRKTLDKYLGNAIRLQQLDSPEENNYNLVLKNVHAKRSCLDNIRQFQHQTQVATQTQTEHNPVVHTNPMCRIRHTPSCDWLKI